MTETMGDDRAATAAEDEIQVLFDRARAGDQAVVPALGRALDDNAALWRTYGDLGLYARRAWINLISGADLALHASLERKAAEMLDELAGPGVSPLERLLAEQVVASWLVLNHADAMAVQAGQAGVSLRQAQFAVKRQAAAHRRHLTAVAALATLQRLPPSRDVAAPAAEPEGGPRLSAVGADGGGESPSNEAPPPPGRRGPHTAGLAITAASEDVA
jgi:hypothetical protein